MPGSGAQAAGKPLTKAAQPSSTPPAATAPTAVPVLVAAPVVAQTPAATAASVVAQTPASPAVIVEPEVLPGTESEMQPPPKPVASIQPPTPPSLPAVMSPRASGKERLEAPTPESGATLNEMYEFKEELGSGNYSIVKRAVNRTSADQVAIKCIEKKKLSAEDTAALYVEVAILHSLNHPNVLKMFGWYEEPEFFYIATELVPGGELFERIVAKEFYSEEDARKVVLTMAKTLKYLHHKNIVHRDLKPENILLKDKNDDSAIKIADFGFAVKVKPGGQKTTCGTPAYVAPEIIMGIPYGTSVDIWSFGVIVYILLCGFPPFYHQNQNQLFRLIRAAKYEFMSPYWDPVSDVAKDLISNMLRRDPTLRFNIDQVISHPWLQAPANDNNLTSNLRQLALFNAKRKLRAALKAIIAGERLKDIFADHQKV